VRRGNPSGNSVTRLLGDLELNRPLRLPLKNGRPGSYWISLRYILYAQPRQIAAAQLAVDSEVEQRKVRGPMTELQSNPNGPDLFQLQRGPLAQQPALVPWFRIPNWNRFGVHEWLLILRKRSFMLVSPMDALRHLGDGRCFGKRTFGRTLT
jgi:hypothetical protein